MGKTLLAATSDAATSRWFGRCGGGHTAYDAGRPASGRATGPAPSPAPTKGTTVAEPVVSYEEATARLTAPGAPFEIVEEEVHGEVVQVFKNRPPHLRAMLVDSVARFGDATYVHFDDGRSLTFAEHADVVASIAAGLAERYGVEKGDRVAILGANSLEWLLTFWATISLGATVSALNGWWQDDEIRYGLDLTGPKVLVADEKRLDRVHGGRASLDVPVVVMETEFAPLWNHRLPEGGAGAARGAGLPTTPIHEDDPAVLMFTSGTTGRPKAATVTHRNLISFTMLGHFSGARAAVMFPRPTGAPAPTAGVNIASSPMFHVSGLQSAIIAGVASGAKYVWTTGRFDPKKVLELAQEHKATRLGGVPTQIWRILEHPDFDQYDLSTVTSSGGGGSVVSPELQRTIREKIPTASTGVSLGYGLTECGGLCTMATNEMLEADPTCAGRPVATAEVAILDDDGKALPDGEVGHVCIRGPMVMPGYWNNPDATAAAFFPGRWLNSGDYGRMVDDMLYLESRKRDMIIRGGENIYPIEIENRIDEHPAVLESAVIGVDHRTLGQEVKAFVVTKPGRHVDADELKAFVGETLAYYKVPEYIETREEHLPRNASGKVLKNVLAGEADNTFVED